MLLFISIQLKLFRVFGIKIRFVGSRIKYIENAENENFFYCIKIYNIVQIKYQIQKF